MGLCCSKLFNNTNEYNPILHPGQPIYHNPANSNSYRYKNNRPPPYNPMSYQFNPER